MKYLLCTAPLVYLSVREQVNAIHQGPIQPEELVTYWSRFMFTLFAVEISNILLVVHCATNWMLFATYSSRVRTSASGNTILRNTTRGTVDSRAMLGTNGQVRTCSVATSIPVPAVSVA